ncbi:MAG: hypothetical protein ABR89_10310 [Rhodobacter sp. BACL10 MAG-120910-bin24]|nr:MAG: hypothetical protein ABR89_10310 [Rhodobacter sp. BACL10 MAG-120910-bin24]KRP23346.1 MAG: hypothetical protein ABR97_07650 [Rhodobacter sp. BACL10 MAG-120419-bin15]
MPPYAANPPVSEIHGQINSRAVPNHITTQTEVLRPPHCRNIFLALGPIWNKVTHGAAKARLHPFLPYDKKS